MTPSEIAQEWNRLWPVGSRMLWCRPSYPPVEVTTAYPAHCSDRQLGAVSVCVRAGEMSTGPVVPISQLIPIPSTTE